MLGGWRVLGPGPGRRWHAQVVGRAGGCVWGWVRGAAWLGGFGAVLVGACTGER